MYKIGVFGDLHLRKGGKKIQGYDQKTLDGLDVLDQIIKVFLDNKIDMFFFLGDFYHNRYQIDVMMQDAVIQVMKKLKNIDGCFITGNHDVYLRISTAITSLSSFSLKWKVVTKVCNPYTDPCNIVCVPFTKEFTSNMYNSISSYIKPSTLNIVFMHQFLTGFPIQKDYIIKKGEEVFDYSKCDADWIISGHDHIPHTKKRKIGTKQQTLISVGSPMELSFQDSDSEDRGCYILTVDNEKVDIKQFPLEYPRYCTVDSVDKVKDDHNYYRLIIAENEFSKTLNLPDNVVQIKPVIKEKETDRLKLGRNWKWQDVLSKYVILKEKSKKYKEVGDEILKEVL